MVDNNRRVSRTGLSLISPDLRTSPPVSTCTSVPGEDERLDAAFAGPRFLLPKAGVDLHAFGPDLIALAGCGGSPSSGKDMAGAGDLDSHSATEVLEILKRLNEDFHKTVVMVTHDPHAASYAHVTRHLEKGMLLPA